MHFTPSQFPFVGSLSVRLHRRAWIAAVALCAMPFIASSNYAQDGGDGPSNVEPVTVIADGLVAGTELLLQYGDVLPAGETLLPGDVVIGGTMVNVAAESTFVMISGDVKVLEPGTMLFTVDPETPAWRCSCRCGTTWRTLNVSSANCGEWGTIHLIGRPCVDPGTGLLADWSECTQVFDLPSYP